MSEMNKKFFLLSSYFKKVRIKEYCCQPYFIFLYRVGFFDASFLRACYKSHAELKFENLIRAPVILWVKKPENQKGLLR